MNSEDDGHRAELANLASLREQFEIRVGLLPADLALAGLLDDLLDASSAAIELEEKHNRAVYPLVRTAFEAAQRLVVLATDDDYSRVGIRAWLYYQHKDASVLGKAEPEKAGRWLDAVVSRMIVIWSPHNEQAAELLAEAAAWLKEDGKRKPRPPDNFMGQDLAGLEQDRYPKILGATRTFRDAKRVNRGIYAALSRDSHARLRIEMAGLEILPGGTARIIPRSLNETQRRRTLLRCLETSLAEANGALSYFLEIRRRGDADKLQSMARRASANEIPPGFRPDLGLHLAGLGEARTAINFTNVPIRRLGVLPNGTACWSANIVLTDREYIATFDVPALLVNDLARAIGISPLTLAPRRELVKHDLDGPPSVSLECVLGEPQHNGKEAFLPLVVKRVARAS